MDDQVVEEDPYSDDDLDALPQNAFHELEEDAFKSTQPPAQGRLPAFKSPHRPNATSLAGGFGRLTVAADAAKARQEHGLQTLSSDYGDLDDEMLDGEIFDANEEPTLAAAVQQNRLLSQRLGESTQRDRWRQQRYSLPTPAAVPYQAPQLNGNFQLTNLQNIPREYPLGPSPPGIRPNKRLSIASQGPTDASTLQATVEQLMREREELHKAVQHANNTALAKAGEIAIVRANASKLEQEYDGKTKEMQKRYEEAASQNRRDLERAKRELQDVSTERKFAEASVEESARELRKLQKDMKNLPRPAESISAAEPSGATTPKRHKTAFRDGFDDDEIQLLTPSKLVHRGKAATPKAGSKRKRKAPEESPTKQSLDFRQALQDDSFDEPVVAPQSYAAEPAPRSTQSREQNFPFIQRFLDHRFQGSDERTIEALALYKFPSTPRKALSTILLDKSSPTHLQPSTENLPAAIALEVISLWAQCIQEGYHDPIHLLLDQVKFILIIKPFNTAPDLTNDLMSLLQETADIVIIPRCQKKPPRDDRAQIESTDCLELIHLMATQLSHSCEESTRFWRTMRFDFIMMLLSFIHPLHELHLTIRILRTSILPQSVAMIIPPNDGKQDATEARVIENLSRLLVEPPRPTQGEPALTGIELAELRLAIIGLLEDMTSNDYATLAICHHRLLLGRLVRLMNDSLAAAYDYTAAHPYLIELVNSATRLLYYFLNSFPDDIRMAEKLGVIPGGEKKFLIVLTRLAFSEGIYLEEGIEDDVVDLAHRMLEERVSPEEAEGLVGVMSSASNTRATTTGSESRDEAAEEDAGGSNDDAS